MQTIDSCQLLNHYAVQLSNKPKKSDTDGFVHVSHVDEDSLSIFVAWNYRMIFWSEQPKEKQLREPPFG